MGYSAAQAQQALNYMNSQVGRPYSEATNLRLGPAYFDCSGLVYRALTGAGIPLPQSSDIANTEAEWLAQQPGIQVISDPSQLQPGDVVFTTGSDPDPSPWGGIGHTGMVTSGSGKSASVVSAYDTQDGVNVLPLSQEGQFTVGMRLTGGNVNPVNGQSAAQLDSSDSSTCLGVNVFGHCFGTSVPSGQALESDVFAVLERGGLFILGGLMVVMGVWVLLAGSHASPKQAPAPSAVSEETEPVA